MEEVLRLLEERVFSVSFEGGSLFNQYNGKNLEIDLPNADEIRRENLRNYLGSFSDRPSIIVIGEAPGWRGCRFSGVPFTSEFQLSNGTLPFTGNQSSINTLPYKESTATIFWEVMHDYHSRFFAWNCIPFHPHKPNDLFSNRAPTIEEIITYLELLKELILLIQPNEIVAVGRHAERALNRMTTPFVSVRHPSHGGKEEFVAGIEDIFS